jgi:hypothetical protein
MCNWFDNCIIFNFICTRRYGYDKASSFMLKSVRACLTILTVNLTISEIYFLGSFTTPALNSDWSNLHILAARDKNTLLISIICGKSNICLVYQLARLLINIPQYAKSLLLLSRIKPNFKTLKFYFALRNG